MGSAFILRGARLEDHAGHGQGAGGRRPRRLLGRPAGSAAPARLRRLDSRQRHRRVAHRPGGASRHRAAGRVHAGALRSGGLHRAQTRRRDLPHAGPPDERRAGAAGPPLRARGGCRRLPQQAHRPRRALRAHPVADPAQAPDGRCRIRRIAVPTLGRFIEARDPAPRAKSARLAATAPVRAGLPKAGHDAPTRRSCTTSGRSPSPTRCC